jgi:hypothetical protein
MTPAAGSDAERSESRLKDFSGSACGIAVRKVGSEQHHEEEQQPQHGPITPKTHCRLPQSLSSGPPAGADDPEEDERCPPFSGALECALEMNDRPLIRIILNYIEK